MPPRTLANTACAMLGLEPTGTLSKDVESCVTACTEAYGDDGAMPGSGLVARLLHVMHTITVARDQAAREGVARAQTDADRERAALAAAEADTARRADASPRTARELRELDSSDALFRTCALQRLCSVPRLDSPSAIFQHGRLYTGPMLPPACTWSSTRKLAHRLGGAAGAMTERMDAGQSPGGARSPHQASTWLTASEYQDHPGVCASKLDHLVRLLKASRRTVVYTGAGLLAADSSAEGRALEREAHFKKRGRRPAAAHHALVRLYELGLVHIWVQTGHDGLAQKAGFPQPATLEPCGSWFDPSNPVVKPGGVSRARERAWLAREAEQADLVLALGAPFHFGADVADCLITRAAERSTCGDASGCLGAVVLGLQQTASDADLTLRVFGTPNELLPALVAALGDSVPVASLQPISWAHVPSMVLLPYTADGSRMVGGEGAPRMYLDLRPNAPVRVLEHNCQGARHPAYMHIGAQPCQRFRGRELGARADPGGGYVRHRSPDGSWFTLIIEDAIMSIGAWWLEAAAAGELPSLPIVNKHARFEGERPPAGPPIETTAVGERARAEPLSEDAGDADDWRGAGGECELALLRESEALTVASGGDAGDGGWGGLANLQGVGVACGTEARGGRLASKSRQQQPVDEDRGSPVAGAPRARRASESEPPLSRLTLFAGGAPQQATASSSVWQSGSEQAVLTDRCTSGHQGSHQGHAPGSFSSLAEPGRGELRSRSRSMSEGSAGTAARTPHVGNHTHGWGSPSPCSCSASGRSDDAAEHAVAATALADVASEDGVGGSVRWPSSAFGVRGGSHPSKAIAELWRPAGLRHLVGPSRAEDTSRRESRWGKRMGVPALKVLPTGGYELSALHQRILLVTKYSVEQNEMSSGGSCREQPPLARPHTADTSTRRDRAVRNSQLARWQAGARAAVHTPCFSDTATLAEILASAVHRTETGSASKPLLVDHSSSPGQTSPRLTTLHHSSARCSSLQQRFASEQRQP